MLATARGLSRACSCLLTLSSAGLFHGSVANAQAPIGPTSWPILGSQTQRWSMDLPVAIHQLRGAVRFVDGGERASRSEALRLHVLGSASALYEVVHSAGFLSEGFTEFYGIEAGRRPCYLRRGDETSGLLWLDVAAHEVIEWPTPPLLPCRLRRLELRGPSELALSGATVLLEYDGFAIPRPWLGEPIVLESPLDQPATVRVRLPATGGGTVARFGTTASVLPGPEPIVIAVDGGGRSIRLGSSPTQSASTPASIRYRLSIEPVASALERMVGAPVRLLAAVDPLQFRSPPRSHTWVEGGSTTDLRIDGLAADKAWLGVGTDHRCRAMLWRQQPKTVTEVHLEPASIAKGAAELMVLPPWMRTIDLDSPVGPGPRRVISGAPSQLWTGGPGFRDARRLLGWRNGDGLEVELPVAIPVLPHPQLGPDDELTVRVRAFGVAVHHGERFYWRQRAPFDGTWPEMPDGLLDAVVRRRGRGVKVLRGVLVDGVLLKPFARWRDVGAVQPETEGVTVVGPDGRPVVGATLLDANGEAVGTTDEDGRCSLSAALQGREPGVVAVLPPWGGFAQRHTVDVNGSTLHLERPEPNHTWENLQRVLGVDLESVGIHSVRLWRIGSGESANLSIQHPATLSQGEPVEFAGNAPGVRTWGWFRAPSATVGPTVGAGRAELVLANRSASRFVHVSLARCELRLEIGARRQQRLSIRAPASISVVSAVEKSTSSEELLLDEVVRADLADKDVLVITFGESW